jgi:exopolysaccharide production protein ExoZ
VTKNSPTARLEGLQCLRAIAALLVLASHIGMAPGEHTELKMSGGWGVDLFFVISGYVIALTSAGRTPGGFLQDRLARVVPPYLVFTFLVIAFDPNGGTRALNTLLFIPALDFGEFRNPAHWFGWSVGMELWFYVLFAGCMLTRRPVVTFVATICALAAVATVYAGPWLLPKFVGSPLVLEFVGGVILQRISGRIAMRHAVLLLAAGAVLCVATVAPVPALGFHEAVLGSPALAWQRLVMWGLPAWLVVAGVVGLDLNRKMRWPAWLVRLGDASYSLYLVQPLAIMAVWQFPGAPVPLRVAALFSLTIVGGIIARRYVEAPMTVRFRSQSPRTAATL